jgi:sensor histidine kinase regulating citrate/malate metabolism
VITFRDRNEIDTLSAQLSQVKRYVDNLRIMRHEQLNRMTTLSGLLHMGRYEEAIGYIQAQSEHAQELLDFISSRFLPAVRPAAGQSRPRAGKRGRAEFRPGLSDGHRSCR